MIENGNQRGKENDHRQDPQRKDKADRCAICREWPEEKVDAVFSRCDGIGDTIAKPVQRLAATWHTED